MTIDQKMKRVEAGKDIKQHADGEVDEVHQSIDDARASRGIHQHVGNNWLRIGGMKASGKIAILVLAVILLCYIAYKLLSGD